MALIRTASPADADLLSVLATETFSETFGHLYPPQDLAAFLEASYAPDTLRRELSDPDQLWLIAEDESGHAIGYVQAGPCGLPHKDASKANGELKRIYIRKTAQGSGLGQTLVERALAFIDERFIGPAWIGVWSGNEGAQRLYGRYGFVRDGGYIFPVGSIRDEEFILRRNP